MKSILAEKAAWPYSGPRPPMSLGWAAFLWIVFRPHAHQRSVSTGPVGVDGNGVAESQVVVHYVTLTQVDGYVVLIPLFIPVLVTGLALLFLLTCRMQRAANALVVWSLTAILLVFCGLGYYGVGIPYLPAAISLTAAAVTFGTGRGLPQVAQGGRRVKPGETPTMNQS